MIRPSNAPEMPPRRDPESLTLSIVEAPLWHPRCGHSPTTEELNALVQAVNAAKDAQEAATERAAQEWRRWRTLAEQLDRAYEAVRKDGDEVVSCED